MKLVPYAFAPFLEGNLAKREAAKSSVVLPEKQGGHNVQILFNFSPKLN